MNGDLDGHEARRRARRSTARYAPALVLGRRSMRYGEGGGVLKEGRTARRLVALVMRRNLHAVTLRQEAMLEEIARGRWKGRPLKGIAKETWAKALLFGYSGDGPCCCCDVDAGILSEEARDAIGLVALARAALETKAIRMPGRSGCEDEPYSKDAKLLRAAPMPSDWFVFADASRLYASRRVMWAVSRRAKGGALRSVEFSTRGRGAALRGGPAAFRDDTSPWERVARGIGAGEGPEGSPLARCAMCHGLWHDDAAALGTMNVAAMRLAGWSRSSWSHS